MIGQILQNLVRTSDLPLSQPSEPVCSSHGKTESLFVNAIDGLKSMLTEARNRQSYEANIRKSIDHLYKLTDEQLRDMGIDRADIAHVVRYGKD